MTNVEMTNTITKSLNEITLMNSIIVKTVKKHVYDIFRSINALAIKPIRRLI